jgi:aromatic ring-cleaving dioxygenase
MLSASSKFDFNKIYEMPFHAHIYYELPEKKNPSKQDALNLLKLIKRNCPPESIQSEIQPDELVLKNQWKPNIQLDFKGRVLEKILIICSFFRNDLLVFIHPNLKGDYKLNHYGRGIWMGPPIKGLPIETELYASK